MLRLDSAPEGTIYLSVSWQPGQGQDFGYRLIDRLDEKGYLVVGDTKGFAEMDPNRLRRIMAQADGFLASLPYRPDKPSKTSGFMLDEVRIALEAGLPTAIIYDERVGVRVQRDESARTVELLFADSTILSALEDQLVLYCGFDFGVPRSEDLVLLDLELFLSRAKAPAAKIEPYAFLITRLQPDFALPRAACIAAVERAAGIPCLWIDSKYRTNMDDTIERVRLLIKHSEFVVAEISLADENVGSDNPSRAHEIGLATAYRKRVFLASREPRRHPYHGLVSRQIVWWKDEAELYSLLKEQVHLERGSIGRHVYNWDLRGPGQGAGKWQFSGDSFDEGQAAKWLPPVSIDPAQRWIYAISFGVIVFCCALLLRRIGYDDTLDLAATLGGIVTLLFASQVHDSIYGALRRLEFLRWFIPLLAALLLVGTIVVFRPQGQVGPASDNQPHSDTLTAPVQSGDPARTG